MWLLLNSLELGSLACDGMCGLSQLLNDSLCSFLFQNCFSSFDYIVKKKNGTRKEREAKGRLKRSGGVEQF